MGHPVLNEVYKNIQFPLEVFNWWLTSVRGDRPNIIIHSGPI